MKASAGYGGASSHILARRPTRLRRLGGGGHYLVGGFGQLGEAVGQAGAGPKKVLDGLTPSAYAKQLAIKADTISRGL